MFQNKPIETDCGVVGGGLAGCTTALELADAGKKVELFVKNRLIENCNSYLIAGGLAAVQLPDKTLNSDSVNFHIEDTLKAGKGLNDVKIVKYCVEHFFTDVIQYLIDRGVKFDKNNDSFDLNREGGHSKNRVFHVSDITGMKIMETLGKLIRNHHNIKVHENHMVLDLITKNKIEKSKGKDVCLGFYVYDIEAEFVRTVQCKATFIATGGLGKVFLYTSNTDTSTGDGFAMCYRAGLPLVNMEFIQFHPTVFYDELAVTEGERRFLLTEALRGAGAILKLYKDSGEDFVFKYDPLGSKATRDVVVMAEDIEMRKHGLNNVWLDCTKIDKDKLKSNFQNSYDFCLNKGIDITKEPVPVVYAEHYSNGGVLVNFNSETGIRGCYVLGETAYTGLHGATRLASSSGPECVLFARLAAKHFLLNSDDVPSLKVPLWQSGETVESKDKITVGYYWEVIRRTMNSLCGMSRNEERLIAAKELLESLNNSINNFYWNYRVSKDFLEVRNIADAASIIIESALIRKESRGCHFREDFPKTNNRNYLGLAIAKKENKPHILKLREVN